MAMGVSKNDKNGFLTVVVLICWWQAEEVNKSKEPQLSRYRQDGGVRADVRLDTRLTGAGNIDQELQKALSLGLRYYMQFWYHGHLSPDTHFITHVRCTLHKVIVQLSQRCKEVDVLTFSSQDLVEDCLRHLRLYKSAGVVTLDQDGLEQVFRGELAEDPWQIVSTNLQATQVYLQSITEVVLFLVLPSEDYKNSILVQLIRDILVWKVWLPVLQMISQPDFINSLIISLCKDSSLNAESLLASMTEGGTQAEREELQERVYVEIDRLKQLGVTAADEQKVAALTGLLANLKNKSVPPPDEECPMTVSTTIPEYRFETEASGRRHVVYCIHVACRHANAPVVEKWTTDRTYTDFHDLHMTLRNLVGVTQLCLPTQRSLNKLDPQFVESRRTALQQYLDVATSEEFFAAHPQVVPQIILFLTGDMYRRSSGELSRMVDSLINPFRRRGNTISTQDISKAPNTSSPNPAKKLKVLPVTGSEEEEEGEFVHVLMVLFDEVFDVASGGQWLRRQITSLVSQLIGDKINRKAIETLDWLTSSEQIAEYLRDIRSTVWPGDYPAASVPDVLSEGDCLCQTVLARTKLVGSAPDDLRRLIGTDTTTAGIARLFSMFQSEALNRRLVLVVTEGLLSTLFPHRNLNDVFREIRLNISKYSSCV